MRVTMLFNWAVLTASLFVAGCAHTTPVEELRPPGTRLSSADAIRIARHAAEHEGCRLSDFKPPKAHYEYTQKDRTWTVSFDGKVPVPGNQFWVVVDDQTGQTQVLRGE